MALATATCPRCGRETDLPPCPNDGSLNFHFGQFTDGSEGMICDRCNLGASLFRCQYPDCGAAFTGSAFTTPVSRVAGRAAAGMNAYYGGKCFIATELYGEDSDEVAVLRRFRDSALLPNPLGKNVVATYYRAAPHVVRLMRRSRAIRTAFAALVATAIRCVRAHERGNAAVQRARSAPADRCADSPALGL